MLCERSGPAEESPESEGSSAALKLCLAEGSPLNEYRSVPVAALVALPAGAEAVPARRGGLTEASPESEGGSARSDMVNSNAWRPTPQQAPPNHRLGNAVCLTRLHLLFPSTSLLDAAFGLYKAFTGSQFSPTHYTFSRGWCSGLAPVNNG